MPSAIDSTVLFIDRLASPVGRLAIVTDEAGTIRAIDFEDDEARLTRQLKRHYGSVALEAARDPGGVTSALAQYFDGNLTSIDHLRVATVGTPFQQRVWAALRTIPCGETMSYGDLARRIGQPSAVRAVGLANGANPIPIVVPCHRVIGASGQLVGYGGGLHRKRWLLAHEGARPAIIP